MPLPTSLPTQATLPCPQITKGPGAGCAWPCSSRLHGQLGAQLCPRGPWSRAGHRTQGRCSTGTWGGGVDRHWGSCCPLSLRGSQPSPWRGSGGLPSREAGRGPLALSHCVARRAVATAPHPVRLGSEAGWLSQSPRDPCSGTAKSLARRRRSADIRQGTPIQEHRRRPGLSAEDRAEEAGGVRGQQGQLPDSRQSCDALQPQNLEW